MPWVISIIALILFCALMHLYIPAALFLAAYGRRKWAWGAGTTLFATALLHSLFERIWPSIFQWNLGYSLLWAKIPTYHFADVVGFEGLSSGILLLNAWIGYIWVIQSNTKKAFGNLAALVVVFLALVVGGKLWGERWNHFDKELRATVIQANIGNQDKVLAEKGQDGFQQAILGDFFRLTGEALQQFPQTDILVWPETAMPDYLDGDLLKRQHPQALLQALAGWNKPLITGAYSKDSAPIKVAGQKPKTNVYNALFLLDAQGHSMVGSPYRKTELLAFGEYLPLSEQFPFILTLLPFVANFGRGHGPDVMTFPHQGDEIRWGGQICYEGLYPEFTRGLSEKGADILVNVTNDSWFGKTFEPHQHLYMTLARAIEVRRPLLRSTNTGISTGILANGQVLQQSPLHQEWFGEFLIRYKKSAPTTTYVEFGHWDWVLLTGILLLILFRGWYHARTRRS